MLLYILEDVRNILLLLLAPFGTLLVCFFVDRVWFYYKETHNRGNHRSHYSEKNGDFSPSVATLVDNTRVPKKILIAYATQTNTARQLSHKLFSTITSALHECQSSCCSSVNTCSCRAIPEIKVLELTEDNRHSCVEHLIEDSRRTYGLVIFIVSTYTDGTAPEKSQSFAALMEDAYKDFRVPRDCFAQTKFAIFGLGDTAYGENYNAFAKNLYMWCRGMGANFIVQPVYASESNTASLFQIFSAALVKWVGRVEFTPDGVVIVRKKQPSSLSQMRQKQKDNMDTEELTSSRKTVDSQDDEDDEDEDERGNNPDDIDKNVSNNNDDNDDVEDLVIDEELQWGNTSDKEPPELLYPLLRTNLQKQGYHLIGSHSGVKLCRWTKAMLRGRGGCYKHTFYNIASFQCMEMTPSLACANKCVFCWRHHTNPVSRTFRWKVDPPEMLIKNGIAGHRQMINQMRHAPGVTAERIEEAMNVRHCALSLVGEPIMYPEINSFVDLLHEQGISSFMVTNAQFPEQLRQLKPVTQLYLSIDAPTPEELKRVDRPLFEDYWERCLACVRELRHKPQRTVFRLTLVNQYNTENVSAYADLVRLGWPDFIEVKGVTYCGTSTTSTLTMKENVPRHEEVIAFCKALCESLASRSAPRDKISWKPTGESIVTPNDETECTTTPTATDSENGAMPSNETEKCRPYEIACEHEHSCCVLVALNKFFVDGVWHTWIDYDKFTKLAHSGRTDFTAADYWAPTPSWAVFQSEEKGFDPTQVRVKRKSGKPVVVTSGC